MGRSKKKTKQVIRPVVRSIDPQQKIEEVKKEFEYYKRNVDKHPLYNSTWNFFYKKRHAELTKEGIKDPEKHDYVSEWIKYWMQYMNEFYENKIAFYTEKIQRKASPISISSTESYKKRRTRRRKSYSSDHSDISSASMDSKKSILSTVSSDSLPDMKKSKESVTLLSVCRTLSVLEKELGSLMSNKIVDIVAQIIQLEKVQANASDIIIRSNDNIVFLETVKEKLKGLISTNLLDIKKIPVVKKCIQNIAQLVHEHPTSYKESTAEKSDENITDSRLTEIITKSLVTFGKTDVSEEELEVIKEIYLEELEKNIHRSTIPERTEHQPIKYESLSDDELKLLIKNFTQLSDEEQHYIIKFISEIEEKDPERVKKLHSFVYTAVETTEPIVIDDNDDDADYDLDEVFETINQ